VGARVRVELGGVAETLLWTLWNRAAEARRPDPVLRDPLAVELVERIDYPFAERFGPPWLAQWQALRARCFDHEVLRFMRARPGGTVVALGEGLETQFWRVDDGRVRWVGVDLPETVALRRRLLPAASRRMDVAGSAFDLGWLDALGEARDVLVTAQGLLMYFGRGEVHGLLRALAARLPPGATLLFDAVPPWLAAGARRVSAAARAGEFAPPPWRWVMDAREERAVGALPGVAALEPLALPRGRGIVFDFVLPLAGEVPAVRRRLLTVWRARFAA
jgi:O-methyltransferase involved in polyketide biosynthesis